MSSHRPNMVPVVEPGPAAPPIQLSGGILGNGSAVLKLGKFRQAVLIEPRANALHDETLQQHQPEFMSRYYTQGYNTSAHIPPSERNLGMVHQEQVQRARLAHLAPARL